MTKVREKKQAIALRKRGWSINRIAKEIGVSKSSVSNWVRTVVLTQNQKEKLKANMVGATKDGRFRGAERNKQLRLDRLSIYKRDADMQINSLSLKQLFFLGLGLYWGEGFKSRSGAAGFSNSDPRVMQVMIVWLEQCLNISRDRLRVQVFISDTHRDREEDIVKFWKQVVRLPSTQFRKVIFLPKVKKVYENRETYYGVCAVRILKGTEIKDRINALIQRSFEVHRQCRRSSVG